MDRETQFTTVLEANRDRIYRICCCYIRNEDERQDVFQDVLLQIWKSLDTFANRSAISTSIFRVAVNVCLGHLRLAQRRNRLFTQEAADAPDPATAGVPATDNPRQKESDLSHLYECIQRLPDLDKTLEEIRLSGISAGTSPRPPTQFLPPRFRDCAARATMRPVAAQFLTRQALDRMWTLPSEDGHFEWEKSNQPPSEVDDHFGATMALLGVGVAPDDYSHI